MNQPGIEQPRELRASARGLRFGGPRWYALTEEGLACGDDVTVRYSEMIGITSRFSHNPKVDSAAIAVFTRNGSHVVPRRLSISGRAFYDELVRRATVVQQQLHSADAATSNAGLYRDVPEDVTAVLAAAPGDVQLFCGRLRRGPGSSRRVPLISLGVLAACFAGAALSGSDVVIGISVAVGLVAVLVLLASLAHQQVWRGREWLCVHAGGIAMVGRHLTGELAWDDIEEIAMRNSGMVQVSSTPGRSTLFIHTFDGAHIPVPDFYDCPLPAIERLGRHHLIQSQHH